MQTFHCQIARIVGGQSDLDFPSGVCQTLPRLPVVRNPYIEGTMKRMSIDHISMLSDFGKKGQVFENLSRS